jgi:nucleotide-binding universal stress UspA family protein
MFTHVLFATDGSELSNQATPIAVQVVKALGAKMTVLNVVLAFHAAFEDEGFIMPKLPDLKERYEDDAKARADTMLQEIKKAASEAGVQCFSAVVVGDVPYKSIIEQAEKSKCDMIMMASHGRRGLQSILLGSETQQVLTHSKIPVLVLR